MLGQSAQRLDWGGGTEGAGRARSQAHAGQDNPLLPATPLPREAEEQKEELHFVSYSDSGSGTKITGICHLDCNLDIDVTI